MIALFVTLLLQGSGVDEAALESPSRAERERALAQLAKTASSEQLAALLDRAGPRSAAGLIRLLARRSDDFAWQALRGQLQHADAGRAEAAATAVVELAMRTWRELPATTGPTGARLDAAWRRATLAILGSRRHRPSLEWSASYRGLIAGGDRVAHILKAIVAQPGQPARTRAHALAAYQMLVGGRAAAPLLRHALDDVDPYVRRTAAGLVSLREAGAAIVARWERSTTPNSTLALRAAQAIAARADHEWARAILVGETGKAHLRRMVTQEPMVDTLAAARAWHALGEDGPIRARIKAMALRGKRVPQHARSALLLLEIVGGPTAAAPDVRTHLLAFGGPLAEAYFAATGAEALRALRSQFQVKEKRDSDEWVRIRLTWRLLQRHNARPADRLAFLRSMIGYASTEARGIALRLLAEIPSDDRRAFLSHIRRSLSHPAASVRVAAARLLPGDPEARVVTIYALYDGVVSGSRLRATIAETWPELEQPAGMMASLGKRRALARKVRAGN